MPDPALVYDAGTQSVIAHDLSYQDEQVSEMLVVPTNDPRILWLFTFGEVKEY